MTPFIFSVFRLYKTHEIGNYKKDYFLENLTSYGVMELLISLTDTAIHSLKRTQTVIKMMDLCAWTANRIVIAFIQQAAFLLLTMIFLNVLLSIQPY